MNEIENLGLAFNDTCELLNQLKCVISEARDNRCRAESARGVARRAADFLQHIVVQNFVTRQKAYVKTKLLLRTCDEDKRQQELDMMKTKAAS